MIILFSLKVQAKFTLLVINTDNYCQLFSTPLYGCNYSLCEANYYEFEFKGLFNKMSFIVANFNKY